MYRTIVRALLKCHHMTKTTDMHVLMKRNTSFETIPKVNCHIANHNKVVKRHLSSGKRILGIETSCDDTGAAIVDEAGNILGDVLHSQTKVHVETGGIIPPVARDLHRQHIDEVVQGALEQAGLTVDDVDAVATTVKPGLIMSLDVGMNYTKHLLKDNSTPFIPIHHMEAHALTARMNESIPFPFLVLLMSGGHCLLSVAKDVDDFLLLGKSLDTAPGDAIDKVARALKLKNLTQCENMSGGQSIELVAQDGNCKAFEIVPKMNRHYNCNFSFSGVRTSFERIIKKQEEKYGIVGDEVLPNAPDICATFQYILLKLIANRVQRAIVYCNQQNLLPQTKKTLVASGGVASNSFLRDGLQCVCDWFGVELVCPAPKLCTDNGIMIAWNGVEKLKIQRGLADINSVDIQAKCPLGIDISQAVAEAQIKAQKIILL